MTVKTHRNVITLATGKELYIRLAANLARSFRYWNAGEEITFYLFTDMPDQVPEDILKFISVQVLKSGELGDGFSPKLSLDKIAPPGQTLFIDSDCLIFGSLSPIFERFKGLTVAVIGGYISDGEWFGDVKEICKKFGLKQLPKFNGGLYYLENGDAAGQVYRCARRIERQYDKIGFVRLRGRPNDEVIMAVAMQQEGMVPILEDGKIMSDPFCCPGEYQINIRKGLTSLVNPRPPDPLHRTWYPFHRVSPTIVHFLGAHTEDYQYKREAAVLQLLTSGNYSILLHFLLILRIELPSRTGFAVKNWLRPVYRHLFGYRSIKVSDRV